MGRRDRREALARRALDDLRSWSGFAATREPAAELAVAPGAP
jgi:hypothetical protein